MENLYRFELHGVASAALPGIDGSTEHRQCGARICAVATLRNASDIGVAHARHARPLLIACDAGSIGRAAYSPAVGTVTSDMSVP